MSNVTALAEVFVWLLAVVLIIAVAVLVAFVTGALVGVAAAGFEWTIRTLGVML